MRQKLRALFALAAFAFAAIAADQAQATATVRVEWLKGGVVYSAENVTSSGASAASGAMPDMGGVPGQARIVPIAGAAVVMHGPTSPTATQTNGVRLQVGQDPITMTVQPGEKVAIIEATDAVAATAVSGGTSSSVAGGSAGTSSDLGTLVLGFDGTTRRIARTDTLGDLYVLPFVTGGQAITSSVNTMPVGGFDGTNLRTLKTDSSGNLIIGNSALATVGTVNSGATDGGAPVKIGGVYNATPPTFTTGQRGDVQIGARGAVNTTLFLQDSATAIAGLTAGADGDSNTRAGIYTYDRLSLFNGSTWDRWLGGNSLGNAGNSAGIAAVIAAPTSSQGQAIAPIVSTAVESSHVIKASAANLYRLRVTAGATAGYLLIFNATSAPADGAVTPQSCTVVAANSTVEIDHPYPDRYTTGITAVFSSTGCFTKTASATAMFEASAF